MMLRMSAIFFLVVLIGGCQSMDEEEVDGNVNPPVTKVKLTGKGVKHDIFQGVDLAVYSDIERGLFVAFRRPLKNGILTRFISQDEFPIILRDEAGNQYDIFGDVVDGPDTGTSLERLEGFMGYWFSVANFYPKPTLYGEELSEKMVREETADWAIDQNFISRGASKEGIPSIDNPSFELIDPQVSATVFDNEERIMVVKKEDAYYAFPYSILDWHEIVNMSTFQVTYCPLTGTGFAVNRTIGNMGVSGLLFNNNLIMYDRNNGTLWSQIYNEAINGVNKGDKFNQAHLVEMTWSAVIELAKNELLPDSVGLRRSVLESFYLTSQTGFNRNYEQYPYGNYRESQSSFLYPNALSDNRVPNKELVYTILVDDYAKVFRFSDFSE